MYFLNFLQSFLSASQIHSIGIYFYHQCTSILISQGLHQYLVLSTFLIFVIRMHIKLYFIVFFTWISLIANEFGHRFICLLILITSHSVNSSSISFVLFVGFLVYSFVFSFSLSICSLIKFFTGVPHKAEIFDFIVIKYMILFSLEVVIFWAFRILRNLFPPLCHKIYFPTFLSTELTGLPFTFWSLIHAHPTLVYCVIERYRKPALFFS